MQRRAFVTGLAAAAALPLAARAGEAGRLPVVGYVMVSIPLAKMVGADPADLSARGLVHGMRDLGWVEGSTVVIERRSAEGDPQRFPAIFAELAALGADVIAFSGTRASLEAARHATQTIPLVAVFFTDPVAGGQVASLARPGGNLTGLTFNTGPEFFAKRLQLLKDMAPGAARVAFLGQRELWEFLGKAVAATELPPIFAQVDRPEEFEEAFAAIQQQRADALYVPESPVNNAHKSRIVAFAAEQRLPAMYTDRQSVDVGGLMSYGPDAPGIFRQLAGPVNKILKGAKPADIPVERPTKFELVINLKTANALGLTIPPLLLARADEVIE